MEIREATPDDRERILALRERCFGDVDAEKRDPRFFDWEFAHAKAFVAGENELATHIALVPMPFNINGEKIDGAIAVDAMTSPDARGAGWFTRAVGAAIEQTKDTFTIATAYQIRGAVLGAMLRNGWQIAATLPVLVRPASLLALAHLPPIGKRGGEAAKLLSKDDTPRMAAVAKAFAHGATVDRNEQWLTWRFFENPFWKYRVTGVERNGELVAYLVARRTTLKGFDTYAVVDLAWTDKAAARELLKDLVAEAKWCHCELLAALVSRHHPALPLLLARGFMPGPHRFRLLVHPMAGRIDVSNLRWSIMWAETDHL